MKGVILSAGKSSRLRPATLAIGKTNLLLRNVGNGTQDLFESMKDLSEHIVQGDTLADDKFPNETFNLNSPVRVRRTSESALRRAISAPILAML